jgi:hypothetical protein
MGCGAISGSLQLPTRRFVLSVSRGVRFCPQFNLYNGLGALFCNSAAPSEKNNRYNGLLMNRLGDEGAAAPAGWAGSSLDFIPTDLEAKRRAGAVFDTDSWAPFVRLERPGGSRANTKGRPGFGRRARGPRDKTDDRSDAWQNIAPAQKSPNRFSSLWAADRRQPFLPHE